MSRNLVVTVALGSLAGLVFLSGCDSERCSERSVPRPEACELRPLTSDVPLTFEVSESCGSPCDDGDPACVARVSGNVVELVVTQEHCRAPRGTACVAVCTQRVANCDVPSLAPGSWMLIVNGEARGTFETQSTATESRCEMTAR